MQNDKSVGLWLSNLQLSEPITIAGPCSAETEEQLLNIAHQLAKNSHKTHIFRAGVWKPRTRPGSFEGVGSIALPWLQRVKQETGLLTAVEVANTVHVKQALDYDIDVLWIGARTTVNPFAVQDIANALEGSNKIVWVKNPVNPDLELWVGAFERLYQSGIKHLAAIHRGFSSYDKVQYRNPPRWQIPIDFKSRFPHIPIICDPSHICGKRDTIESVAQTALDLQYDGLMIETHCTPDKAWSDAQQQITPKRLNEILDNLIVRASCFTDESYLEKLKMFRHDIDEIDQNLLNLLFKRMQVSHKIGLVKKEKNVAVLQNQRFNDILNNIINQNTNLSKEFIKTIFKAIHEESIKQQEKIVNT